jgi:mRNA-degrading endonuclease RelE of RelBE toxin-antitoxin system
MWNDRLRIAESVAPDWNALDDASRIAARDALRTIDDDPIIGAPLFEPLKGLWSYRTGNLRIVYRIVTEGKFVVILGIAKVKDAGPA